MNKLSGFFSLAASPKIIGYVGSVSSIISAIFTIASFAYAYLNIFSSSVISLEWMPYAAIGFMIIPAGVFWYDNTRLRKDVHKGLKMLRNDATVVVDTIQKRYKISLEKEFKVISGDLEQWFDTQFYCNNKLESGKEAKEYYAEHAPIWEDLNVYASMKYKNPNDPEISENVELKVEPITNKSFYIPFHIYYAGVKNHGGSIEIKKGAIVKLTYGYEVSATLWGSYLNRTLSFFGEKATFTLRHPNINNKSIDLTISERKKHNSDPIKLNVKAIIDKKGNEYTYKVVLPQKSSGKYRVWWDSMDLLGIPSTKNIADDSKMTDY